MSGNNRTFAPSLLYGRAAGFLRLEKTLENEGEFSMDFEGENEGCFQWDFYSFVLLRECRE